VVHRAVTAISTVVVAIVLALTVPVSQLRTVSIVKSCCCPDPERCHCPDHDPGKSTQPSMRACHQTSHAIVAPHLPAFTPPAVAIAAAPARVIALVTYSISDPHGAPPPARPDAPS
jgi:hypothetical protein